MNDDPLLRALGRVAAEQSAERERWETSAGSGVPDAGADAELAKRLFAPASEESMDRLAAKVTASLARPVVPAGVVSLRSRPLRWAGFVAAPLAAAAAIALLVGRPAGDLPGYSVSVSGGLRAERGADVRAPSDPVIVASGSELVLVARPSAASSRSVHVATFVVDSSGATAVPSTSEASDKGAVRVKVLGADLAKAAGTRDSLDLVLVLDRSSEDDGRALLAGDGSTGEWTRFKVPVRISGSGH